METEDKDLLKRFLNGQCTAEENLKAQELLQQEDAQEVIQELTWQEWNEPAEDNQEHNILFGNWKTKLNSRISTETPNRKTAANNRTIKLSFLRYAAIWAGLVLVSSITVWQLKKANNPDNIAFIQKINTDGQPERYLLPDSSEVYLGAGSKLRYPAHFAGKLREIELQGEAFFQVKHDASQPFIIHTGEIQTQVLGTSFKVQSFTGRPLVVAVATGKVGVSRHHEGHTKTFAMLTPGMKVTWNTQTKQAVQGKVDPYSLEQWKAGDMVFDEQSIAEIADELQRRYAIKLDFIDKEVTKNQISGTFPATKSAGQVMNTLAAAGKFTYESKDNKSFKIYKIK